MVDWDLVERRRSKGWEWERIAEDEKVGFHPDESAGDPGRALRTLYYQRRSKAQRRSGDEEDGGPGGDGGGRRPAPILPRAGLLLTPTLGLWAAAALAYPSLYSVFIPAVPDLLLALLVAAAILGYGLLTATDRWVPQFRSFLIVGVVLGGAVAGGVGIAALSMGCPVLSTSTSAEPLGWEKAPNHLWEENGAPVFFFYGSIACPYCSASSWPMVYALKAFGTLTGTSQGHSSSTDVYPNTPELILASAQLQSPYVALHVDEATNDNAITTPATSGCVDSAYLSTYDPNGGIPFVVIGGKYVHDNSLVDPSQLRVPAGSSTGTPLTPSQVQDQMANSSGPAWNAIAPQMYMIEALIYVADGGQPASLLSNTNVAQDVRQIT